MRTKKDERKFIEWRREQIRTKGSARGTPTARDLRPYDGDVVPTHGEECVILRRRLGLSTATVQDVGGLSHVTVIGIEKDAKKDRHGYRKKLLAAWKVSEKKRKKWL